jgi:peptidoglycan/LPS O-acetylase OafA/YrhL
MAGQRPVLCPMWPNWAGRKLEVGSKPQPFGVPMTSTSVSKTLIRYIVGGLLIGGFWYLNRGRTPWEEALRTIATFAVLMMVMRVRLRRKSVDVHLVPLLAAKAVLIVIAAVIEEGLEHSTGDAALIVAIGLGLAVALLGPLGDHRFFTPMTPTPTTTERVR